MAEIQVLIGTPLKGEISPYYARVLADLSAGELPGYKFHHAFMGGTCVFGARDILANRALVEGYDKLIFWDADLKPRPADFVRLLSHSEDFVCGAYCKREIETHWHFFPEKDAEILPSGLWNMSQAAIGFSCIDLSVFKKIRDRMPEATYKNKEQGEDVKQYHQFFPWQIIGANTAREKLERLRALLDHRLDHAFPATELLRQVQGIIEAGDYSANLMQGEDYGFCRQAREAGIKVWLDTKLVIPHAGTCDFPVPHDDLVRMIAEPWRQDHWAKLKAERAASRVAPG